MTVYLIPAALVCAGLIIIAPAIHEPRFQNPEWRNEFIDVDPTPGHLDELVEQFYDAQARNLNPLVRHWDQGVALISLGLSMTILLAALRVRSFRDLWELKTLPTSATVVWSANLAWWGWVPAQIGWFWYTQARGDYPWFSDIVLIPIGGAVLFCTLGFPIVLSGAYLATRNVALPVRLAQVPKTLRSTVATVLATIPLAWFLFAGARALFIGDLFTMPVSICGVYAILSVWAAACPARGPESSLKCNT